MLGLLYFYVLLLGMNRFYSSVNYLQDVRLMNKAFFSLFASYPGYPSFLSVKCSEVLLLQLEKMLIRECLMV